MIITLNFYGEYRQLHNIIIGFNTTFYFDLLVPLLVVLDHRIAKDNDWLPKHFIVAVSWEDMINLTKINSTYNGFTRDINFVIYLAI